MCSEKTRHTHKLNLVLLTNEEVIVQFDPPAFMLLKPAALSREREAPYIGTKTQTCPFSDTFISRCLGSTLICGSLPTTQAVCVGLIKMDETLPCKIRSFALRAEMKL